MSKLLDRVKTAFGKKKSPRKLPPGSYPQPQRSGPALPTVTKPPDPVDDDDEEEDDDEYEDDDESYVSYNVPEQTRARDNKGEPPQRNPATNANPPGANPPLRGTQPNPPERGTQANPPQRGTQPNPPVTQAAPQRNQAVPQRGGAPPGANTNQPAAPPTSLPGFPPIVNLNSSAPPGPPNNPLPPFPGFPPGMNPNPAAPGSNPPFVPGGFPPPTNPGQSSDAPPTNQPSAGLAALFKGMGGNAGNNPPPAPPPANQPPTGLAALFSGMGGNAGNNPPPAPPPANQPPTGLAALFSGMGGNTANTAPSAPNTHQGYNPDPSANRHQRHKGNHRRSGSVSSDNASRLELDYPIENVLIDANIPSSMAIKVNEAVERDRLGRAYHIHRYTYDPPVQHLSVGGAENVERHTSSKKHRGGRRHIREIYDYERGPTVYDASDLGYPGINVHRRRSYSDAELNQYLDHILHRPDSFVVHAYDGNDLQEKINRYLYSNNQFLSPSYSTSVPQYSANTMTAPFSYFTAHALPNDPMRHY